jgi:hypothetical protein
MRRPFFTQVTVLLGLVLSTSTRTFSAEPWQTYVDNTYQVILSFPEEWKSLYNDRPYFAPEPQLNKVSRGFFQLLVSGGESDTLEQVCKGLAEHKLKPFGVNPTIRLMKVDGQSACLIWASEDQGAPWDAEIVIKYPEPVEIQRERYSFLELNADKDYILAITRSLRFISPNRRNSLFSLAIVPENAKGALQGKWKEGTPFSIRLTIQNKTTRVLRMPIGDPFVEVRCIRLHTGERVPVMAHLKNPRNSPTRNALVTLSPQRPFQDVIEIFTLSEQPGAGEYSLQLERDLPSDLGRGIVRSNTIEVTMIE